MAGEKRNGFKVKRISSWSITRVLQTQEGTPSGEDRVGGGLIIYGTKRKIRGSIKVSNFYIKAINLQLPIIH